MTAWIDFRPGFSHLAFARGWGPEFWFSPAIAMTGRLERAAASSLPGSACLALGMALELSHCAPPPSSAIFMWVVPFVVIPAMVGFYEIAVRIAGEGPPARAAAITWIAVPGASDLSRKGVREDSDFLFVEKMWSRSPSRVAKSHTGKRQFVGRRVILLRSYNPHSTRWHGICICSRHR